MITLHLSEYLYGQAECKCNSDSVLRNYFLGKGFAKPRLICFGGNSGLVSRAEEGEKRILGASQGQSATVRDRTERFFNRKILLV